MKQELLGDGRNHVAQLQSQEKKAGDRQSVPNIEESIVVQLGDEAPANNESAGKNISNDSVVILTDEDFIRRKSEEQNAETNKT